MSKSKLTPPRGIWPWPEWAALWSTGHRSGVCYEHTRERAVEKAKREAEEEMTCSGCGGRKESKAPEISVHRVGPIARVARGVGWKPCRGCERGCKHHREDFVSCCLGQNRLFRIIRFVYQLAESGDEEAMKTLDLEIES